MISSTDKIITHVSNFRKVKRINDVIDIFYGINKKIKSKLFMIGDGPEKKKAEKKVKSLGIKDKVVFFGKSNETNEILMSDKTIEKARKSVERMAEIGR